MSKLAEQRVLVTGATGFIGRRLVRRLIENGCRVSCLVRSSAHGAAADDEFESLGAQRLLGDVTDRESIDRALADSGAETVFHLAGVLRSLRRGNFQRVNEGGVANVVAASARCATSPTVLLVSSLAAAGPSAGHTAIAAAAPRREGDLPAPVSWYGRSKLAGEQAAQRCADAVPITIVRPPIVFGAGDRAVLELFRPIARWGVFPLCSDQATRVAFVHVDDLIEGLIVAAERGERVPPPPSHEAPEQPSCGQGIYFVADQHQPTLVELGTMIATALGKRPPKCVGIPAQAMKLVGAGTDAFGMLRGRPGLLSRDKITEALAGSWVCSSEKAWTDLRWSPAANLSERLHETAQWYRNAGWI